jgi:uncharacterized membrane protein
VKNNLIRGMLNTIPLIFTLWLFWSILVSLDHLGSSMLQLFGWSQPWAGFGFSLIIAIFAVAGLAFSVSPVLWVFQKIEQALLLKFPLFKTVYGASKDLAQLMNQGKTPKAKQTVLVKQSNGTLVVGFITASTLPKELTGVMPEGDWVPVLFQLSYQIAGVTTLVRREDLIFVDWSVEDALRFMLTAGVSQTTGQVATDKP